MDRNSLLQSTFEIVTWPEIQDYMTIDNFRENAILINEEPFVDIVGSSAYFVNTEWKRKADLEIAYNNGYSDAEYKNMKCKLSTYVVKHSLTTLKYNNISQVCPYKDLGNAKDYIIILSSLMLPQTVTSLFK